MSIPTARSAGDDAADQHRLDTIHTIQGLFEVMLWRMRGDSLREVLTACEASCTNLGGRLVVDLPCRSPRRGVPEASYGPERFVQMTSD